MRRIVLDTETTGLDPEAGHRIIEAAALELVDRRLTGAAFHRYFDPERDIEAAVGARSRRRTRTSRTSRSSGTSRTSSSHFSTGPS